MLSADKSTPRRNEPSPMNLSRGRPWSVVIGDPTQPDVNHGPQADEVQYNIVKRYIGG